MGEGERKGEEGRQETTVLGKRRKGDEKMVKVFVFFFY